MLPHTYLQSSSASCGRVVFHVLLAYVYRNEAYLAYPSHLPASSSFAQIIDQARFAGVSLSPMRISHYPSFLKLNQACIALIYPNSPHYVFIRPQKRFVYVFDPGDGEKKMTHKAFWTIFTHQALLLMPSTQTKKPPIKRHFSSAIQGEAWSLGLLTFLFALFFWWIPPFQGQAVLLASMGLFQVVFFMMQSIRYARDQRRWFSHYQPFLVDATQYQRWLQLGQLATLRPLRAYLEWLMASLIFLYLSSISFVLLGLYLLLACLFIVCDTWVTPFFQTHMNRIEVAEKQLKFPLKPAAFSSSKEEFSLDDVATWFPRDVDWIDFAYVDLLWIRVSLLAFQSLDIRRLHLFKFNWLVT